MQQTAAHRVVGGKIGLNPTGVISNYQADNSGYINTNFVIAQRPDSGGCIRVNNSGGTTTAEIFGSGTAEFAGQIRAKELVVQKSQRFNTHIKNERRSSIHHRCGC